MRNPMTEAEVRAFLNKMEFSVRLSNCLWVNRALPNLCLKYNVTKPEELFLIPQGEFLKIKNLGRKSWREYVECMVEAGMWIPSVEIVPFTSARPGDTGWSKAQLIDMRDQLKKRLADVDAKIEGLA